MVVDIRRLSPWGPTSAKPAGRKFEVRATVARLEGLVWPMLGEGEEVAVMVLCKGPKSRFGRRKKADRVTLRAAAGANGVAEFGGCDSGFGCISGSDQLGDWEVCFSVLYVSIWSAYPSSIGDFGLELDFVDEYWSKQKREGKELVNTLMFA